MARKDKTIPEGTEVAAIEKMAEDIQQVEELYSDGLAYDIDRLESEIKFWQDQAGCALLEMGKRFIRIKAHEGHGRFMQALENVGMTHRSANYAMAAARRFSNSKTFSNLTQSKMIALTVLDDEDVESLASGGKAKGVSLDEINDMSVRQLRETLRKKTEQLEKEKEARKKDRDSQEQCIAQKEAKINELDQQLRYQQPPTKEQLAVAELNKHTIDYTYALAEVSAGIQKAYNVLRTAEKIDGVDVQMLSEWLNQFDNEMTHINDLKQGWTDEVDNAAPVQLGKIKEAADVPELG